MKRIAVALSMLFLMTACSINDPRLSFGKKCHVSENDITYSYIWLYDKKTGLPATKDQCVVLDANK